MAPTPATGPVRTLPDLLRPGLDLVFVGINPGERSAQLGHYYGHPGNVFWRMLSASPLVDGEVGPHDDSSLAQRFGIGFTDVVKRVETDSTKVRRSEVHAARPAFERRIADAAPTALCFNSATAFKALYPRDWVAGAWGLQTVRLADAAVWVMPSTSGLAAGVHSEIPPVLAALAEALGRTVER